MTAFHPPSRSSVPVLPRRQPPPMFILSRRAEADGSIHLILAGELDLAAQHHLDAALTEAQDHCDQVVLDVSALTFIDCTCLTTLFAAGRRARRERAALILLGPLDQVRRLFSLVGSPPGVAVLEQGGLPEHLAPVAA
jgi:anti-anti-sigma factor